MILNAVLMGYFCVNDLKPKSMNKYDTAFSLSVSIILKETAIEFSEINIC